MRYVGPAYGDFSHKLLDHPGALVWWYVDIVDAEGNGAVFIWSWGLPFLPGLLSSARRGIPEAPRTRPSLNIAVYRAFRPEFYVLREFDPEDCDWGDGVWRFRNNIIRQTQEAGRCHLTVSIDLELSGTQLPVSGALTFEGPLRRGEAQPRDEGHSWEPLSMGSAYGSLSLRSRDYASEVSGRAYHDRNGGLSPLCDIGVSAWRWGRYAMPDGELGETSVVEDDGSQTPSAWWCDRDGHMARLSVDTWEEGPRRLSRFGPTYPATMAFRSELGDVMLRQRALMDDSPFYQRALGSAFLNGVSGPGVSEWVDVGRIDMGWMRPLVRMRVDAGHASSMWLPLFNGAVSQRGLGAVFRRGGP